MQKEKHVTRTKRVKETEEVEIKQDSSEIDTILSEYKEFRAKKKEYSSTKETKIRNKLYDAMISKGINSAEIEGIEAKIYSKEETVIDPLQYLELMSEYDNDGNLIIKSENIEDLVSTISVTKKSAGAIFSENDLSKVSKVNNKVENVHVK